MCYLPDHFRPNHFERANPRAVHEHTGGRPTLARLPCLLPRLRAQARSPTHLVRLFRSASQVLLSNDHAGGADGKNGVSFSTDHSALYTRAEVNELRIDASMAATKKTYAHCRAVITEKDATINNALQDERDRFEAALEDSDSD